MSPAVRMLQAGRRAPAYPARPERDVKRAEYHVHTAASYDSKATPQEIFDRALESGLDVLCVTDHDTIEGAIALHALAGGWLRVVVGCELTADDGSHVIGLELRDAVAERRLPAMLERIKLQGATVVLPHPFRRGSGVFRDDMRRTPEFVREVLSLADAVECFNARDSYAGNRRSHRFALERGFPAVAGSDAHRVSEIGRVYVEYDEDRFVHGVSPRRIFFPAQVPVAQAPLMGRAMELYHRNERRFPPVLARTYRALRARLGRDGPRGNGPPRLQYDLDQARRRSPP